MAAPTLALDDPQVSRVNRSIEAIMAGAVAMPGARFHVIKVTPTSAYTAGGDTFSLAAYCPNRVFFAVPLEGAVKNATTGYMVPGIVPGASKTDQIGGFANSGWKLQMSAGASEASGDVSAYVFHMLVCGC
jgi:hypothetical protein